MHVWWQWWCRLVTSVFTHTLVLLCSIKLNVYIWIPLPTLTCTLICERAIVIRFITSLNRRSRYGTEWHKSDVNVYGLHTACTPMVFLDHRGCWIHLQKYWNSIMIITWWLNNITTTKIFPTGLNSIIPDIYLSLCILCGMN